MVSAKALPKGELYARWQKKTNRSLGVAGAEEDGGEDFDDEGGAAPRRVNKEDERFLGFKKYRHTSNRQTQVRPRCDYSIRLCGVFNKLCFVFVALSSHCMHALFPSQIETQVPGRKAKEELKNVTQIKKDREKKAKEKARMMKKKQGGGQKGGGGGKGKGGGGKFKGKGRR